MFFQGRIIAIGLCIAFASLPCLGAGEQTGIGSVESSSASRWIQFAGTVKDRVDFRGPGVAGVTFAMYREQDGGVPLWMETQNVAFDAEGRYSVLLGSVTKGGLPLDLFSNGEARWLGMRIGETEQPRLLLVSVPYALNSANAETLGGRPATDYVLTREAAAAPGDGRDRANVYEAAARPVGGGGSLSGSGTTGKLSKWVNGSTGELGDSVVAESNGFVGIGTTTPTQKLDVAGTLKVGGSGIIFPDSSTLSSANALRARQITYLAGCETCAPLTDSDDQPMIYQNQIGNMTIVSVSCYADAGSPTINLKVNGSNILSSAGACSSTGASLPIDPAKTLFPSGHNLDFEIVNAGNATHRVTVMIKTMVN